MFMKKIAGLLFSLLAFLALPAAAADTAAPAEIKIGTIYASSGGQTLVALPPYMGMEIWVNEINKNGGIYVKPYNKKIPVKLVAYDSQSDTSLATTLYNRLVTQDKVDILVAGGGSILTAPAVPLARQHEMLLFNQSGSGVKFFTPDNPYMVLTGTPMATLWSQSVADFFRDDAEGLGIKRVAMLYATNDFAAGEATAVREAIKATNGRVALVYDQGVPTKTSNYTVLLNAIRATGPDAVIQFGYPDNDVAFLRNLGASGIHFNWTFSSYPGFSTAHMLNVVGADNMKYIYTYSPFAGFDVKDQTGMSLDEYQALWNQTYPKSTGLFGWNAVVGYTTGLIIQESLAATGSMAQLDIRKAVYGLSDKLITIEGMFKLDKDGGQLGEIPPLAQMIPDGKGGLKFNVVYPRDRATAKPLYPAPRK